MYKSMVVTSALMLLLSGCGPTKKGAAEPAKIQVTSSAFSQDGLIPQPHTCDGVNISPDISWSGVPSGTQSFALILEDPDAPEKAFTHWVVFNLPSTTIDLPQAISEDKISELGAAQGVNDFGKLGYGGACPPVGDKAHRYVFTLYALNKKLDLASGASKDDVIKAMEGHIIGQGSLTGTYVRS